MGSKRKVGGRPKTPKRGLPEQNKLADFKLSTCLHSIVVDTTWEFGSIPLDLLQPRPLQARDEDSYVSAEQIKYLESNRFITGKRELNRRAWVEWVRIVLVQSEIGRLPRVDSRSE